MRDLEYGDWRIDFDPPPIPSRNCDWQFQHKDYDGAEDSDDPRAGHGASLKDCIDQIIDLECGDPDEPYLIWSNEHGAWWRPHKAGYCLDLDDAGRYSRSEAIRIAARARDGWQPGKPPPEIALPAADAIEALADNQKRGTK